MDQGVAALLGATLGMVGTGVLAPHLQRRAAEAREERERKRAAAAGQERLRGIARIVCVELVNNKRRVKHAPEPEFGKEPKTLRLGTTAWEEHQVELCTRLPEIADIDPVVTAYSAVDDYQRGLVEDEVKLDLRDDQIDEMSATDKGRELLDEALTLEVTQREAIEELLDKAIRALRPWLK